MILDNGSRIYSSTSCCDDSCYIVAAWTSEKEAAAKIAM